MAIIPAPSTVTHDIGSTRFTSLATPTTGSKETSVWLVAIDPGAPVLPHKLTREEVFVVLEGRATVTIGNHESTAKSGDAIVVPVDTLFSLGNAGGTVLQLLCCLPVGGQAITEAGTFTPPWAA